MSKPIYESSTQFKHWRFSKEALHATRTSMTAAAVQSIRTSLDAEKSGSSSQVEFITAEEELLLVKLYLDKIKTICVMFRFATEDVEATAVSYVKRFYIRNTVMDWHPKNVMLTALFLAAKVTNNPIPIEAYATRIPNTKPSDVLDLEFLVAQSISFDFALHHVHRALYGLWLDLQTLPDTPPVSPQVYQDALKYVRRSRLTDAEFIYTPSQIALASLSLVDSNLASMWIASKLSGDSLDNILGVVSEIALMITTDGQPPDTEVVRLIDRKVRICTNPARIPGTKAYIARQEEEEQKEQEKRERKAQEIKQVMQNNDPFEDDSVDPPRTMMLDDDD